jgi:hypothetical protein
MARPEVKEPKKPYTIMLKPSVVEDIDKMAEKLGLTRSQFMGNLVETALEDAKMMDDVGLFKVVMIGDKVMRKFKEALFSGRVSLDKNGKLEVRK